VIGRPLAQVLAEHRLFGGLDGGDDPECGCGATPPEDWWGEDFGDLVWHESHLAIAIDPVVARLIAEAWMAERERIAAAIEDKRPHIPPLDHPKRLQCFIQRDTLNRAARIAREARP